MMELTCKRKKEQKQNNTILDLKMSEVVFWKGEDEKKVRRGRRRDV
jgi:hypothetical protein